MLFKDEEFVPVQRLCRRWVAPIGGWQSTGKEIPSCGSALRCGDVFLLRFVFERGGPDLSVTNLYLNRGRATKTKIATAVDEEITQIERT
ncbi:hypothetical protein LXL04_000354 [Taraxacum kok-saghyz]